MNGNTTAPGTDVKMRWSGPSIASLLLALAIVADAAAAAWTWTIGPAIERQTYNAGVDAADGLSFGYSPEEAAGSTERRLDSSRIPLTLEVTDEGIVTVAQSLWIERCTLVVLDNPAVAQIPCP